MENFASDFKGHNGLTPEETFAKQLYDAFVENTKNNNLPFFNKVSNIPRELSTGKIINDHNVAILEQVANQKGYKSNFWIYGHELNRLQKEIGSLNYKPKTTPVLCSDNNFYANSLTKQDLHISDNGSKQKYQYLYNLDSLDERSQQKILKKYEELQLINKEFQKENYKHFSENVSNLSNENENFNKTKERAVKVSSWDNKNFIAIVNAHYKHNLMNSLGMELKNRNPNLEKLCYQQCNDFISKVESENIPANKAGRKLCEMLLAGTELQRISVAQNHNLENAKIVEEKLIAAENTKPYSRMNNNNSYTYDN